MPLKSFFIYNDVMKKTEKLYLGSASPRRFELIRQMGIPCEVLSFEMEEIMDQDKSPEDLSLELSNLKMGACLSKYGCPGWVVTADTLISLDDHKIGKPASRDEARYMLQKMQNRIHQVYTGITLFRPDDRKLLSRWDRTDVQFAPLSGQEMEDYLDTDEWRGAAGGYRIQEKGGMYIVSVNGSYFNVMGLPINLLYGMLRLLKFSI